MKKLTVLLLVLSSWACSPESSDEKSLIIKLMKAQEQAWNKGDIDGFMSAYINSDSLLFIGSSGPNYGYQKVLNNYKKSYPSAKEMGQLKFEVLHLDILSNDYAHMVGGWSLKRDTNSVAGYFSLLWKKEGREWKIIRDHSS